MNWMSVEPKEHGFYWWRENKNDITPIIVKGEIIEGVAVLLWYECGSEVCFFEAVFKPFGQWMGPLKPENTEEK